MPGQGHVVTLQQYHLTDEIRVHRVFMNNLDQVLSRFVMWMSLAGKYDHYRALRVVEQSRQSLGISEQHQGALVGGKTSGEAHHQNVRIGAVHMPDHALNNGITGAIATLLLEDRRVNLGQQLILQGLVDTPVMIIRYLIQPVPVLLVEQFVAPVVKAQIEQARPTPWPGTFAGGRRWSRG